MIDSECEGELPELTGGLLLASGVRPAWALPVGAAYSKSSVSIRRSLIYWLKGSHGRFLSSNFPMAQHLLCLKFKDRTAEVVQGPRILSCHQFSF